MNNLIPGWDGFINPEVDEVELPVRTGRLQLERFRVDPTAKRIPVITKVSVKYIPTELKARYGYRHLGKPKTHGKQFDPFNDIAEGRLTDEVA